MGAGKPTQKFELNFQKEISEQIKDLKIDQLMRLFVAILDILSISFVLMNEHSNEFIKLFKSLGKALGEGMKAVKTDSPISQLGLTHPNRTFRIFLAATAAQEAHLSVRGCFRNTFRSFKTSFLI